ncbi:MAG: hypothetical protein ABI868_08220 [Acidobacteriota bacterium]
MHRPIVAVVSAIAAWSQCVALGGHPASPGNIDTLTRRIPQRSPRARTGSRVADALAGLDARGRERTILGEILDGNMPSFLRQLAPVELSYRAAGRTVSATIFVTPDYLAIGSDDDFLRIPMNLATATTIADAFGFVLPTRKMVNAVYEQSGHHFVPLPLPAGPRMTSTDYYRAHNALIEKQARAAAVSPGTLVSGHKKDVVLTNLLTRTPGRLAIYGWHRTNGAPIQPLSIVHGACYVDYSHGVRLVADRAWQDGELRPVREMLRDGSLASALSDEGVIRVASFSSSCSIGVQAGH